MSVSLHIDRIENVYINPGIVGTEEFGPLLEQILAGADAESLRDIGYKDVADEATTPEVLSDEEQEERDIQRAEVYLAQEDVNSTARANFLRNVVSHVDTARKLEGFQTNHYRRPKIRPAVDTKQAVEYAKAEVSLEQACGVCAVRQTCTLAANLGKWIDVHPYKVDNSGKRRPGSLTVKEIESRTKLLRALRRDPLAHCDPAKRT